jgi:hypothetical protein
MALPQHDLAVRLPPGMLTAENRAAYAAIKARCKSKPEDYYELDLFRLGVPDDLWPLFRLMGIKVEWQHVQDKDAYLLRLKRAHPIHTWVRLDNYVETLPPDLPRSVWNMWVHVLIGTEPTPV